MKKKKNVKYHGVCVPTIKGHRRHKTFLELPPTHPHILAQGYSKSDHGLTAMGLSVRSQQLFSPRLEAISFRYSRNDKRTFLTRSENREATMNSALRDIYCKLSAF